jgi:hypothetical protein
MAQSTKAAKASDEEILYGTSHACALIGCDPSTLRHYANTGIIPSPLKSTTGRHMWRLADLRAAMDYRAGRARPALPERPKALDR